MPFTGASVAGAVVDQIVVSVGPYMFWIRASVAARRSRTSVPGRASPPIIRCLTRASARRASSLPTSIRAIEGVHCRWVTSWRMICAAME